MSGEGRSASDRDSTGAASGVETGRFSSAASGQQVSMKKVTTHSLGFKGWHDLRRDDLGVLWEHFVLNELHAHLGREPIRYWRSKHGNEVDFVVTARGAAPVAIECKWSAGDFDASGVSAFRARYPGGATYVVATDVTRAFAKTHRGVRVQFVSLAGLIERLTREPTR